MSTPIKNYRAIIGMYIDGKRVGIKRKNITHLGRFAAYVDREFPNWAFVNYYAARWDPRKPGRNKYVDGPLLGNYVRGRHDLPTGRYRHFHEFPGRFR